MASVVYRCPMTGQNVQAWFADDEPDDDNFTYVSFRCPACARLHLVNGCRGRTLGGGPAENTVARSGLSLPFGIEASSRWRRWPLAGGPELSAQRCFVLAFQEVP